MRRTGKLSILLFMIMLTLALLVPINASCACISYIGDIKTGKVIMGERQPFWEIIVFRILYGEIKKPLHNN